MSTKPGQAQFVTVSVLIIVALFGPAVALIVRESDVAFFLPVAALAAAALARWGIERPERQFRRRYLRDEGGRRQVAVGSELVLAWLAAAGSGRPDPARHPWADRLVAGVFNGAIAAVLLLGMVWFFNIAFTASTLDHDPPGKSESHLRELRDARAAARRPFPALALDLLAGGSDPASADRLAVLLRDSTRRTVERLAGAADAVLFRNASAVSAATARRRLELAAAYDPLGTWRTLASPALPLLWYQEALVARRAERTSGGAPTSTVAVAAACQCNLPLRDIGRFATLQSASAMLAAARGDRDEALRRAVELVSVGRNLGRDPLTAAAGSAVLSRAVELLGALAPILGRPSLAQDAAALATYQTAFDQAVRVFAGKPAIKAAVRPLIAESLLALAGDTSLEPVYRRGLARAAVLGACYTGEDLFFNVDRERERLVDSVLARVADLPEAAAYAASARDLDWRRSGYSAGLVWDMLGVALWVLPRISHCETFGLLRDTTATR